MPAKRPARPPSRQLLQTGTIVNDDPKVISRHLSDLATAVNTTAARVQDCTNVIVDLDIGDNRITHGLGRVPHGASVTPTVADATFAWALSSSNDRQLVITVIGAAQPRASVAVW